MPNTKVCTCCHVDKALGDYIKSAGKSFYACRSCTEVLTAEFQTTPEGTLCYRCGWRRPAEAFETNPRGDGLRIVCRSCRGGSQKYKDMGQPSAALVGITKALNTSKPTPEVETVIQGSLQPKDIKQAVALLGSQNELIEILTADLATAEKEIQILYKKFYVTDKSLKSTLKDIAVVQAENTALRCALDRETQSSNKAVNQLLGNIKEMADLNGTISSLNFELSAINGLEEQLALVKSELASLKAPEPLSTDFLSSFLNIIGISTVSKKDRKAS